MKTINENNRSLFLKDDHRVIDNLMSSYGMTKKWCEGTSPSGSFYFYKKSKERAQIEWWGIQKKINKTLLRIYKPGYEANKIKDEKFLKDTKSILSNIFSKEIELKNIEINRKPLKTTRNKETVFINIYLNKGSDIENIISEIIKVIY